jgi:hypothetical protein
LQNSIDKKFKYKIFYHYKYWNWICQINVHKFPKLIE